MFLLDCEKRVDYIKINELKLKYEVQQKNR